MYLALYRKWRPKLFDDVVAQEHITLTLKNEVKFNKVAHAYLFMGPRGTGKTSCARIFAKALNCLNNVDGEPCCKCKICIGIEEGTILDVVELDGASSNSVNDVKILRDEASFVPSYCKFKIYIIDEVHMLSSSAFNALLKIMEEPPKHVIFILATTEANKVIDTIVSRCQRFDFKRIGVSDIEQNLVKISNLENIDLTRDAAKKLALLSSGSMRDAVSFLDECFAVSSNIDLGLVNKIFGFVDETQVLNLFVAVSKGQEFDALQIIDGVYESGKDLQVFCSEFIEFCREILMCAVCRDHIFDVFSEHVFEEILNFSKLFSVNFIVEVLTDVLNCFESLKLSLNRKLKFEILVLNLCFKFKNFGNNSNNFSFDSSLSNFLGNSSQNINSLSANISGLSTIEKGVKTEECSKSTNLKLTKSELKLEPLSNWQEILNDMEDYFQNEMLFGFLIDSKAYVSGDKLYIDFKNPIVSRKVLEKSSDIAKIVKQKTGKQYRIFVKKSKINTEKEKLVDSSLNNFLDVAKKLEIDIDEN